MRRKSIHLLIDNVAKAPNAEFISLSFMLAYKLLASAVSKCELNSCTSGRKANLCDLHSLVPCVITKHRRWQLVMARTNITARLDRQPW